MTYQVKTNSQWLQIVNDNASDLRKLIANYHPLATAQKREHYMPITAAAPEAACENVRQMIWQEQSGDPLERWDKAVSDGDVSMIMSLLSDAWFGVPESTSCWSIPGFSIACDLMDDPPEDNETE
jgi:hypothetical protein